MTYKLKFLKPALREWRKLGATVQNQFKAKLDQRLQMPRIQPDQIRGYKDHYKIKLRRSGYRLVYEVRDDALLVTVIAVGRRDRGEVYEKVKGR